MPVIIRTQPRDAMVSVYRETSVFAIATGGFTGMQWNAVDSDQIGMFDNGEPTRLTCVRPGNYLIGARLTTSGSALGSVQMRIRRNGTTNLDQSLSLAILAGGQAVNLSATDSFLVGDYVAVEVNVTGVGSINILQGRDRSWFSMSRVG